MRHVLKREMTYGINSGGGVRCLKKFRVCRSEPFIKDNFISLIDCSTEFLLELACLKMKITRNKRVSN
jgi:hypothetical protein